MFDIHTPLATISKHELVWKRHNNAYHANTLPNMSPYSHMESKQREESNTEPITDSKAWTLDLLHNHAPIQC